MKTNLILLTLLIAISSCTNSQENLYNGSPVIKAKLTSSILKIDDSWYKGRWTIAPKVAHDTLKLTLFKPKVSFEFKTDIDSIVFELKANTTKDFYVQLNEDTYAHTIIQGIPFQTNTIKHSNKKTAEISVKYQTETSEYLNQLKKEYPLDFVTNEMSDTEIVLKTLNWTNSRWKHNGGNSPSKSDAITILKEAEEGQEFPCFAYAIVLKDQLNALGFKARTVYLKTEDAEHRKGSPGHVVTEVFLNDLQKWVFVDGQFNVMPTLNSVPLNGVEFQNAINNNYLQFELKSLASETINKSDYITFVYDYLFYFDTTLDNRYGNENRHKVNNKKSMMLVPLGANNLSHIDFWNSTIDYCIYTNSLNDFYAKP